MESTNELMDVILGNGSPEEVTDKIKELLFAKSSEKLDSIKPFISKGMFGNFEEEWFIDKIIR